MGAHRPGQVSIGAFVDLELRNYLDRLRGKRRLENRSEALRAIILEHMQTSECIDNCDQAVTSKENKGNEALTPSKIGTGDNHQE